MVRRAYVVLTVVIVTGLCTGLAQAERLTLVEDGRPVAGIVLAAEPTRAAQFAVGAAVSSGEDDRNRPARGRG